MLRRLAEGGPLDAPAFLEAMHTLFPQAQEAAEKWVQFAQECIDSGQQVDFTEEPDQNTALSRWYDTLLASFLLLERQHGREIVTKVVDLACQGMCLYPYEMEKTAIEIKKGAGTGDLIELMKEGKLDADFPRFPRLREVLEIENQAPRQNMDF